MPKKIKNPVGRPTEYSIALCEKIIAFFSIPPTYEEIVEVVTAGGTKYKKKIEHPNHPKFLVDFANHIGISYFTLTRWANEHPEFGDAYKQSKILQERLIITNGLLGHYNASVAIFTMKNIAGWRDQPKEETPDELINQKLDFTIDQKELPSRIEKFIQN